MIRVLIAEDEPPIQRRTKRMIEQIDADFSVAALVADGEEALEKMQAEHFDVLFTDIRMPIMDGMQLMNRVQSLYPDCSIVVLSGYQDFEYVSTAVRAQAVDYLLKPITDDTLEKLLFKLKERHTALKQERMQQSVAARLHYMQPNTEPDGLQVMQLGICLFCAGAMPQTMNAEIYDAVPDVWKRVSLAAETKTLCRSNVLFVQEFIGSSQAERILIYQLEDYTAPDFTRQLYEEVRTYGILPVNCICLNGTASVADIGKVHKRLRRILAENIIIGENYYQSIDMKQLTNGKPESGSATGDMDAVAQYAEILSAGDACAIGAFRDVVLEQIRQERWTQQRVLRFFQRVMALLDVKSHDPQSMLPNREWFFTAIAMAASLKELTEIVQSLESFSTAGNEGNETMAKVEEYLRLSYAQHITGQTLAKQFGYVPSYISFLFRQTYGKSPTEYLTQLRLERAKELMRSKPDLLLRDVAEQVGYKNQYHFSRVFKRNEGLWPTEFKQ